MRGEIDYEFFASDAVRQRFWSKVVCVDSPTDTCWHWLAYKSKEGYGYVNIGRSSFKHVFTAHRAAWILTYGTIDSALTLDHLCRNPSCVNPAHMEQVSNRVNILRGNGASAQNARKTHCPQGHAYSESNTTLRQNGDRRCLTCQREQGRIPKRRALTQEQRARKIVLQRARRQRSQG